MLKILSLSRNTQVFNLTFMNDKRLLRSLLSSFYNKNYYFQLLYKLSYCKKLTLLNFFVKKALFNNVFLFNNCKKYG